MSEQGSQSPELGFPADGSGPDGGSPVDAAALCAGSPDPAVRARASALLDEQIKLAVLQRAHLHTQHIRDRFLVAFDLALAVAGLVIVCIIVALFWDAYSSRSVIIEPFGVPDPLSADGYSSKAVAAMLRNDLRSFQDATRTNQSKRSVTDAWSNRVQLQIPEAGISIDDIQILLHRWLSSDEHIGGSIARNGKQVLLTVEGDRIPPRDFSGSQDNLRGIVQKAAEYIYGSSEPYLFCVYLFDQGRMQEVIALAKGAFASAPDGDKPLLLNVWANALSGLGRYGQALEKVQQAVRIKPDFWMGYDGMMGMEQSLGHEEAVVQIGRRMERMAGRGRWISSAVPATYWENLDFQVNDWPAFHSEVAADMAKSAGHGTEAAEAAPVDAWSLAQMHDWRGAELELETSPGSERDKFVIAQSAFDRAVIAFDRKDYKAALADMKTVQNIVSHDTDVASTVVPPSRCWLARAEGLNGEAAAEAADSAGAAHFVDCLRFEGDVAERKGRWDEAVRAYRAAVALAPSVPTSYQSWGEALLRHGLYAQAIAKFSAAHERGPHWADPLEHWGEALAATKHWREAMQKFAAAAPYAPQWGVLYLNWGRALDAQGRHAEALEKYRAAWASNLTAQQRSSIWGCCS